MSFFNLFGGKNFKPETDIPDLSDKVIFITGGNIGLGKQSVIDLAKHNPKHIYLAARSAERANDAIKDIKTIVPNATISFIECDLASLTSVRNAAEQVIRASPRLDILLNNAGVMALPPGLTKEGYEIQFGTNHLGHALLTKLLLPTLLKTAEQPNSDVRIINVSSAAHKWTPSGGIVFKDLQSKQEGVSTFARYGQSKLANILHTSELARRYPKITSVSVHPGAVSTNLAATFTSGSSVLKTINALGAYVVAKPAQGALNQLWAATAQKDEIVNGQYYTPVAVSGGESKDAKNKILAGELWDWTEKELEKY